MNVISRDELNMTQYGAIIVYRKSDDNGKPIESSNNEWVIADFTFCIGSNAKQRAMDKFRGALQGKFSLNHLMQNDCVRVANVFVTHGKDSENESSQVL